MTTEDWTLNTRTSYPICLWIVAHIRLESLDADAQVINMNVRPIFVSCPSKRLLLRKFLSRWQTHTFRSISLVNGFTLWRLLLKHFFWYDNFKHQLMARDAHTRFMFYVIHLSQIIGSWLFSGVFEVN